MRYGLLREKVAAVRGRRLHSPRATSHKADRKWSVSGRARKMAKRVIALINRFRGKLSRRRLPRLAGIVLHFVALALLCSAQSGLNPRFGSLPKDDGDLSCSLTHQKCDDSI